MNNKDKVNSAKKLRILRFSGVLAFVGTFIFALIFTGNDQFLKVQRQDATKFEILNTATEISLSNSDSSNDCNSVYQRKGLSVNGSGLDSAGQTSMQWNHSDHEQSNAEVHPSRSGFRQVNDELSPQSRIHPSHAGKTNA